MADTAVVEPDSERLQAAENRLRLMQAERRLQELRAPEGNRLPQAPILTGTPEQAVAGDTLPRTPLQVTPPAVPRTVPPDVATALQPPPGMAPPSAPAPDDVRDFLPGFEFRSLAPALPKPAQMPAPELAPPLMAEGMGVITTRGVPTALLEAGATALTPGPFKPIAGAVASGAGELLEQQMHGEPVNWKKAGVEAGLSAIPEVAESAGRAVGRTILRNTPGGAKIRFAEAARQARAMAPEVFRHQTQQQIGDAFERVRQSGVAIDTQIAEQEVKRLTPGKYDELVSEAKLLDRRYKTGGRYADLVERLRTKTLTTRAGHAIGDLQQLSSGLRIRADELGTHEAQTLVRDFRTAIDDGIDSGMTVGRQSSGTVPQDLMQARAEWARFRAAEELTQLVERNITSTPDLAMNSFNLRRFYDDLRRGQSAISKDVNRALDLTPGARDRFNTALDALSQQFQTIELPLADVSGFRRNAVIAGLGQALSAILVTEPGQRLFREAIVRGRGQVSPNMLALMANAARREELPGANDAVQKGLTPKQ